MEAASAMPATPAVMGRRQSAKYQHQQRRCHAENNLFCVADHHADFPKTRRGELLMI
jgi:hypothetical protein